MLLSRWLRSSNGQSHKQSRKVRRPLDKAPFRPHLDQLEHRDAPANLFVVGAEIDDPFAAAPPPVGIEGDVRIRYGVTDFPANTGYTIRVWLDGNLISSEVSRDGVGKAGTQYFEKDVGDWLVRPGTHSIRVGLFPQIDVPESNSSDNVKSFNFTPGYFQSAWVSGQKFVTPIAGKPFEQWTISNYVDIDPGPLASDYLGKSRTYNNSRGLDFRIAGFDSMDRGVPVYAAAKGIVVQVHDGEFDRNSGGRNGNDLESNYIIIDHGNGWQTQYQNLRKNSVAVSVGDIIESGDSIGLVGSSGNSESPGLHFVVTYHGRAIETYLGPSGYWVSPQPYAGNAPQSNAVLTSMTHHYTTENAGFVTLAVPKVNGALSLTYYIYSGASAKAGSDYDEVSGSLVFAPTEMVKFVQVPIRDNDTPEGNEHFDLMLFPSIGNYTSMRCVIIDDDAIFNYRSGNDELTVRGEERLVSNGEMDSIKLEIVGSLTKATVNGYSLSLASSSVDSVVVYAGNGGDNVIVDSTGIGTQTHVDLGDGSDSIIVGSGNSMARIRGDVTIVGGGGFADSLLLDDLLPTVFQGVTLNRSYTIGSDSVARTGIGTIRRSGIETALLVGSSSSDTFNIAALPTDGTLRISANAGTDTLVGPDAASNWVISTANGGELGTNLTFTSIENLTGGSRDDFFRMMPSGSLAGNIRGGAGDDSLDYSWKNAVTLQPALGRVSGITGTFSEIETVLGGGSNSDQVMGSNVATNWLVGANNTVTVAGIRTLRFESLKGGTQSDTFRMGNGAAFIGTIDGGNGGDTLDYSASTSPLVFDLPSKKFPNITNALNMESVIGGSAADTILGNGAPSGIALWTLTGANAGQYQGPGLSLNFAGVENLTGNSGVDWFMFRPGGSVSGAIDGRNGVDQLNYQGLFSPVTVDLRNATATNTGVIANIESMIGGPAFDTLRGFDAINSWSVSGVNRGSINGTQFSFSAVENLVGGPRADQFTFAVGAAVGGTIDGGLDIDTLDYSAFTTNVNVDLTTGVATAAGGVTNIENAVGGSGNDTFIGNDSDNLFQGNNGRDILRGMAGADILLGGWGDDELDGGDGRDILLGGINVDSLLGGGDQDILIGGVTTHDANPNALSLIRTQWKRTDLNYQERIDLLRLVGMSSFKLNSSTVAGDSVADRLIGGIDLDWFWADAPDVLDRIAGETLN